MTNNYDKTIIDLATKLSKQAAKRLPMVAECDLREAFARALISLVTEETIMLHLFTYDDIDEQVCKARYADLI